MTLALIMSAIGGGWLIFQQQLSTQTRDIDAVRVESNRHDTELRIAIRDIQTQLDQRRSEFVQQVEHRAFKDQVNQFMATPFLARAEFDRWEKGNQEISAMVLKRIDILSERITR